VDVGIIPLGWPKEWSSGPGFNNLFLNRPLYKPVTGPNLMPAQPDHQSQVTLYALQTCSHCRDVKKFLQRHQIAFRTIYVDLLTGEERSDTIRRLKQINPAVTFPTITVNEIVVVGFKKKELRRALSRPS
jgi:glutaredoxin-like protein NrdH